MTARSKFTSNIMIFSSVFSLLSLAVTHDLTLDRAMSGLTVSSESVDHSDDAPGPDKCEVCHVFQHMDVPAPHFVRIFSGQDRLNPGRATDVESLALTPAGPPPQYLIA